MIYFDTYCINVKFEVANIPIECILGNPFLAVVEPHSLARLEDGRSRYFIFVPNNNGYVHTITLPFVSTPRISTMIQEMQ